MERDKRGRFVKKYQSGSTIPNKIIIEGKEIDLTPWHQDEDFKNLYNLAYTDYDKLENKPSSFEEYINGIDPSQDTNRNKLHNKLLNLSTKTQKSIDWTGIRPFYNKDMKPVFTPIIPFPQSDESSNTDQSAGMHISDEKNNSKFINKINLANTLELLRSSISYATNNKIADRAIAAEKPLLQNPLEHYRPVYGNYRAQKEGYQSAAQLRNLASRPITSDGALQSQMQMEAQLKGNQFISEGNKQDENLIRQTNEVAWQQDKENAQQRHAVAEANRKFMFMADKNKRNIENMRDSANYTQIIAPLLAAQEQRMRSDADRKDAYLKNLQLSTVEQEVWNTYDEGLTDQQKELRDAYLSKGYTGVQELKDKDATYGTSWNQLLQLMNNEILKRSATIHGIDYEIPTRTNYGIFSKQGGIIYKAKLTARSKDNDRASKSIAASRKIAAKFLEKAMDSLYTYKDVELIAKPINRKKQKYQAGGGLPFVGFTPVFTTSEQGVPQTTASNQTQSKKGEDLTNKDVLELLKELDGLPTDIAMITNELQNFALSEQMDPLGLSSTNIASRYINLISKIQTAKFNKDEYNEAFKQLKSNGGLSEFAITSDGSLIGTNESGNFKYFSVEDIKNSKHIDEGYTLLTNSNLLYLRANSSNAAFNHQLITVAQNGIGMATINSLIQNVINNLGTDTNQQEGYISSKQGELISGLQEFQKAVQNFDGTFNGTINDLYKYKQLTKSQAMQAKQAMQYIYNTLPENAKTLLKIKSDGTEQGALQLIESVISSKESTTQQFDLDLIGGKTQSATNSSKDSDKLKTSLPLNVQKGIGGTDSYVEIDRGDGIYMNIKGTQYNLIKTPNGEAIIDTSLANMLSQSGLQSIITDMRNIQFGDQKLPQEVLNNITYNNTGVTRANLPINPDGSVNLQLLEAYEKAEQELDLLKEKTPEQIKAIYDKYGLSELLNSDGSYNMNKFAPFLITEGYTTDALSGLQPSDFVKEYTKNEDLALSLIEKSLSIGSGKNVQIPEVDEFQWYNPADWFGWADKIYKGVIYIPIDNNVNSAVLGANQTLDYDEAMSQEEKYQNFDKMTKQRSTSADLLNIQ